MVKRKPTIVFIIASGYKLNSTLMLKIASFNLENLFTRAAAMNKETDAAGKQALEDHAIVNEIILHDILFS